MKMPKEIKKGLEYCHTRSYCSDECPFYSDERCVSAGDALAYIQQLEAQNAELVRKADELAAQIPKWISTEDRVPDNDDDVLIITEFGMSMGYYDVYRDYWVDYTNADSNIVTHWMPLPEPPKEG